MLPYTTFDYNSSNAQEERSEKFSDKETERSEKYTEWRTEMEESTKNEIEDLINESKESLDINQSNFVKEISGYINDGAEKHAAILGLYELTAGDSVGASYLKNSTDEMKQANFWRWCSIAFLLVAGGWILVGYINGAGIGDDGNIIWPKIISAFSLTAILLWGGAYSAQQSTKHRNNEKQARRFALEIKAFDPFISSLDKDTQSELKKELSERLFGQVNEIRGDDAKVIDEHVFNVVAKAFSQFVKNQK